MIRSLCPGALLVLLVASVQAQPAPRDDWWRIQESQAKERAAQKLLLDDGGGTPGMELYDVRWYGLDLELSPSTQQLTAEAAVRATVTGAVLRDFELHLTNQLVVDDVVAAGQSLVYTHAAGLLRAVLPRDYTAGETVEMSILYHGNPNGSSFAWDTFGAEPLVWTLSEPYGAREWWPCKDLNDDKADSVDVTVHVPVPLIVAGNGTLVSQESSGGWSTFHWRERHPICTYLVFLAAHPYVVQTASYDPAPGVSMPILNYVVPAYAQQAAAGYALVPDMIAAFAGGFGEYPFLDEKYGHAHFGWGGGMEHQTCASMIYSYYGQTFIAHELSHQWWGDMITCATFHHIWLNEGFATWSEAYWREQHEGPAAYRDEMAAAAYYGPGTIFVEDPYDFGGIFNYELSYLKASWVVHMLRGVLGDDDFFAGLALYRARFAYGAATTEDLQAALEEVSGRDLGPFMQQWIYGEYYPYYRFAWRITPQGGQTLVQARIEQIQSLAGVFTMPIDLRVTTTTGNQTVTVENDRADQSYSFLVPGAGYLVELDPDNWILKQVLAGGATAVADAPAAPARLTAYPNPFNPATTVHLVLDRPARADLAVYDTRGRRVRALLQAADLAAGAHDVRWDGRDDGGRMAAAGLYIVRLRCGSEVVANKLTLAK